MRTGWRYAAFRARVRAAEQDTSVSALVREFLQQVAAGESEAESLKRQERMLREQVKNFSGANRLSRDAVHGRSA